jgi:hypothetical protein
MVNNAINKMVFPDQVELDLLCEKYGQWNVEQTMIYITQACDNRERSVAIPATAERVEKILDAVHGEFLNG